MNPRRKQPEQIFQRQVAEFLTLALPTPDAWFTSIPAGWGGMTRGPGYRAGTPDMLVLHEGQAIWLELKSSKGRLTYEQEQCHMDLVGAGCDWALCRTLEDVERALRRFGVPLRATVGGVVGKAA